MRWAQHVILAFHRYARTRGWPKIASPVGRRLCYGAEGVARWNSVALAAVQRAGASVRAESFRIVNDAWGAGSRQRATASGDHPQALVLRPSSNPSPRMKQGTNRLDICRDRFNLSLQKPSLTPYAPRTKNYVAKNVVRPNRRRNAQGSGQSSSASP
jgi:hypothetical protein